MKLIIDIPEQMYLNAKADTLCGADILVSAIKNGIPQETVTEFADRCRECGREKVLDKIRAEIEQTTSRYTISRERGAIGQVEWSDRLIKESEVLEILDKYKSESDNCN